MSKAAPQAHISLAAIAANYDFLRALAPKTDIGGVVKANAYGLGMTSIAKVLWQQGCRTFFVANMDEAITLRACLQVARIIVLHGFGSENFQEALHHKIIPTLNDWGALSNWAAFARQCGTRLSAFIHFDTGMSRLGFSEREQAQLQANPSLLDDLTLEGWMSHFARSDEFDCEMSRVQKERLLNRLASLPKAPICLCNSSGLFWGHDFHFDLARPGLALYGGNPTPHQQNPMKPVLTLTAPILQVRPVEKGETVGYGASFEVIRAGRLASVAMGYADGYARTLSNKGFVQIGEHLAPVVGRISMDQMMIDISDVPEEQVYQGRHVTILGAHRSLEQIAAEAGTIAYEILTSLGPRVERIAQ